VCPSSDCRCLPYPFPSPSFTASSSSVCTEFAGYKCIQAAPMCTSDPNPLPTDMVISCLVCCLLLVFDLCWLHILT
jgi:hypothetical protein